MGQNVHVEDLVCRSIRLMIRQKDPGHQQHTSSESHIALDQGYFLAQRSLRVWDLKHRYELTEKKKFRGLESSQ